MSPTLPHGLVGTASTKSCAPRRSAPAMHSALAGLSYANAASLEPGLAQKVIGPRLKASVSRLELFAACHFAHYVEYFLRLEPRIEADIRDVDIGTLCHAILEKFIGALAAANRGLAELEDDEIGAGVDSAVNDVLPRMADDLMLGEARNSFLLSRGREHLRRVLRWQRNSARVTDCRPYRVEYAFGYADIGPGRLKLVTPKGREVYLRGRIDASTSPSWPARPSVWSSTTNIPPNASSTSRGPSTA